MLGLERHLKILEDIPQIATVGDKKKQKSWGDG